MRRLAHWLLVLALSCSIGLPWAFLQSAAWLGMIVSYSREAPISKSIEMTFDGEHPCKLCEAVQRGESSQKKQQALPCMQKLDLAAPDHDAFIFPAPCQLRPGGLPTIVKSIAWNPPTPPPEAG